jgi:hypothetical protein
MENRMIKVETVDHGYALTVGEKSWLLSDERELAEAVVFRVSLNCKSDVSKARMHKLMNCVMYGDKRERSAAMKAMCN